MGQMHFHVPDAASGFFHASRWQDAYLCGIEGVPWQTRNVFHPGNDAEFGPVTRPSELPEAFRTGSRGGGRFTLNRSVATSAKLLFTCPIEGIGFRVLTTCSLRCIDTPHRLLIELARGSCYRVQTQSDTWQRGGLSLNERFEQLLQEGTRHFLDALQPFTTHDPAEAAQRSIASDEGWEVASTRSAVRAITLLEQAASELGDLFSSQSISFRRSREPRFSTMLAVGILPDSGATTGKFLASRSNATKSSTPVPGSSASTAMLDDARVGMDEPSETIDTSLSAAFNTVAVQIGWGQIENASGTPDFESVTRVLDQCAHAGMRVIGGPIIDHREGLLPDWLMLMDNDFEKLMSAMTAFVESTVTHFRGRVHLWNAASGLNVSGPLGLDDEQVMRFSIGVLQTIRRCDPNTPVIMSIDQPCGEYLAHHADGISPIHFADALLRSGLGVAGIGLNFRFGYDRGDTHPRSSVEFAQVIDRWGTLSTPLLVQLSVPAAPGADPAAKVKTCPVSLLPEMDARADQWARQQLDFARPLIDTLLAKQIVHAVVWDGGSDQAAHVMPHAGVIDAAGNPRPMLAYLTGVREEFLM